MYVIVCMTTTMSIGESPGIKNGGIPRKYQATFPAVPHDIAQKSTKICQLKATPI